MPVPAPALPPVNGTAAAVPGRGAFPLSRAVGARGGFSCSVGGYMLTVAHRHNTGDKDDGRHSVSDCTDVLGDRELMLELSARTLPLPRLLLATTFTPSHSHSTAASSTSDSSSSSRSDASSCAGARVSRSSSSSVFLSLGVRGVGSSLLPGLAQLVALLLPPRLDAVTVFAAVAAPEAAVAAVAAAEAASIAAAHSVVRTNDGDGVNAETLTESSKDDDDIIKSPVEDADLNTTSAFLQSHPVAAAEEPASAGCCGAEARQARALLSLPFLSPDYAAQGVEDRRDLPLVFAQPCLERAPTPALLAACAARSGAGEAWTWHPLRPLSVSRSVSAAELAALEAAVLEKSNNTNKNSSNDAASTDVGANLVKSAALLYARSPFPAASAAPLSPLSSTASITSQSPGFAGAGTAFSSASSSSSSTFSSALSTSGFASSAFPALTAAASPWSSLWTQASGTLEASLPLPVPLAGLKPRFASLLAYAYWRLGRTMGLYARASLDCRQYSHANAGPTTRSDGEQRGTAGAAAAESSDADAVAAEVALADAFTVICPSMRDALFPLASEHWVATSSLAPSPLGASATAGASAATATESDAVLRSAGRFAALRMALVEPARRAARAAALLALSVCTGTTTTAVDAGAGSDQPSLATATATAAATPAPVSAEEALARAGVCAVTAALHQVLLLGFDVACERAADYVDEQETLAESVQALIALALSLSSEPAVALR